MSLLEQSELYELTTSVFQLLLPYYQEQKNYKVCNYVYRTWPHLIAVQYSHDSTSNLINSYIQENLSNGEVAEVSSFQIIIDFSHLTEINRNVWSSL